MGWVFLTSLANRWLWLFAAFAAGVLVVTGQVPVWFAVLAGVAVVGVGAGADTVTRMRRSRVGGGAGSGDDRPAVEAVRDPEALMQIDRAAAAVRRLEQARDVFGEVPGDLSADVGVKADLMLDTLQDTGRQVDRMSSMLTGIDSAALRAELDDVERTIAGPPSPGDELLDQLGRTADGLRHQLAAVQRLAEQRRLMLERMRTTAVSIEGLTVRVGEIGALYEASGSPDTGADDLRSVTAELEGLRQGLVEAERRVRVALDSTDLPGLPG